MTNLLTCPRVAVAARAEVAAGAGLARRAAVVAADDPRRRDRFDVAVERLAGRDVGEGRRARSRQDVAGGQADHLGQLAPRNRGGGAEVGPLLGVAGLARAATSVAADDAVRGPGLDEWVERAAGGHVGEGGGPSRRDDGPNRGLDGHLEQLPAGDVGAGAEVGPSIGVAGLARAAASVAADDAGIAQPGDVGVERGGGRHVLEGRQAGVVLDCPLPEVVLPGGPHIVSGQGENAADRVWRGRGDRPGAAVPVEEPGHAIGPGIIGRADAENRGDGGARHLVPGAAVPVEEPGGAGRPDVVRPGAGDVEQRADVRVGRVGQLVAVPVEDHAAGAGGRRWRLLVGAHDPGVVGAERGDRDGKLMIAGRPGDLRASGAVTAQEHRPGVHPTEELLHEHESAVGRVGVDVLAVQAGGDRARGGRARPGMALRR